MNLSLPDRSNAPTHDRLGSIQRWMQAVITHPDGVEAGLDSTDARALIDVSPERIEEVVRRSQRLSATERLRIYANAYFARLVECLRNEFPALSYALGEEGFDAFALAYLDARPSRSYTLNELGAGFSGFLRETRPADDGSTGDADWPEFLIDLATIERCYSEVFDGPGIEGAKSLAAEDLAGVAPEHWPDARLIPAPCLRTLALSFPVHEYVSAVRRDERPDFPVPGPTFLLITRRDWVLRRWPLRHDQYVLLSALAAGRTIGEAIEELIEQRGVDTATLGANLEEWFREWAGADLFLRVEL